MSERTPGGSAEGPFLDFEAAPMATLGRGPASPQAEALVSHLLALMEAHEWATGARQRRRRAKDAEAFRAAAGAFLADLLVVRPDGACGGLVYRSLDPNSFSGGPVS